MLTKPINHMENNEMSPGQWALTLFLSNLPLIGLVLLIVWAVGDDSNVVRKNYAKGALILYAIVLAITMMVFFTIGGAIFSALNY